MERRQFLVGVGALTGAAVINRLALAREVSALRLSLGAGRGAESDLALGLVDDESGQPEIRSVDSMWNPGAELAPVGIVVPEGLRAGGGPVFEPDLAPLPRKAPIAVLSGRNLDEWPVVVGDGIHAAEGEAPVGSDDIVTDNLSYHSVLRANVERRAIMAHNITYMPVWANSALDRHHFARYRFRLPHELTTDNRDFSAQTIEGGLFVWDGAGERLEHGVGFQWTVNPWSEKYGHLKIWTKEGWLQAGHLEADREWHTVSFTLDPANQLGQICLDDHCVGNVYTRFEKPDSWGSEISARLQVEIISLDPGNGSTAPEHQAEVRDWVWEWS